MLVEDQDSKAFEGVYLDNLFVCTSSCRVNYIHLDYLLVSHCLISMSLSVLNHDFFLHRLQDTNITDAMKERCDHILDEYIFCFEIQRRK